MKNSTLDSILAIIIYGGLLTIPFLPILVSTSLFFPFITGKGFAFRIIVEVITVAWLILALRRPEVRPLFSRLGVVLTIFIGVIFLADLFAENPFKAFWSNFERMEGFFLLLHLYAFFLVTSSMFRIKEWWHRYFHVWMGVGLFTCLFSILQVVREAAINQGGVRIDATLGNATYLAVFLFFIAFFSLLYLIRKERSLAQSLIVPLVGFGTFIVYTIYLYADASKGVSTAAVAFFKGVHHQWLFVFSLAALFALGALWSAIKRQKKLFQGSFVLSRILLVALPFLFPPALYGEFSLLPYLSLVVAVFGVGSLILFLLKPAIIDRWIEKIRQLAPLGIYAALFVISSYMLYTTATRGASLGFIAALLLAAVLSAFFEKDRPLLRKFSIAIAIAIGVSIGGFIALQNAEFVTKSPVLSRFRSISSPEKILSQLEPRFLIWNIAWQGFKERPILGWGQEGFNFVFNKYYNPALYGQEPWFDRTHNIIFDWLIAGGILGLVAYLAILVTAWYYIWERHKRGVFESWKERFLSLFRRNEAAAPMLSFTEKSLLSALLFGYFIQNMVVFDNLISYILFFSVLAYIHAIHGREHPKVTAVFKKLSGSSRSYAVSIAVILAVGLATFYYIPVKGFGTSRTLIQALVPQEKGITENLEFFRQALRYDVTGHQEVIEQLVTAVARVSNVEVPAEIKAEFAKTAEEAINAELSRNPNDARLWMFKGTLMSSLGRKDDVLASFKKASELTPNKQTMLFTVGTSYIQREEYDEALKYLKQAYDLVPEFGEARYLYAVGAVYAKRFDLAKVLLKDQQGNYGIIDMRIIQAYAALERYQDLLPVAIEYAKREPNNADIHTALAIAYLNVGKREDAIKELEIVRGLRPNERDQFDYYISEIRAGRNP